MATDIVAVNCTSSVIGLTDVKASLDTDASQGANAALIFTAVEPGVRGNTVKIVQRFVDLGEALPLTVSVYRVGEYDVIDIQLEQDETDILSTGDDIKAAVAASFEASQLVTVADKAANDGSGVAAAFGLTALSGGAKDDVLPNEVREIDSVSDADLATLVAGGAWVSKQANANFASRRAAARTLKYGKDSAPRI